MKLFKSYLCLSSIFTHTVCGRENHMKMCCIIVRTWLILLGPQVLYHVCLGQMLIRCHSGGLLFDQMPPRHPGSYHGWTIITAEPLSGSQPSAHTSLSHSHTRKSVHTPSQTLLTWLRTLSAAHNCPLAFVSHCLPVFPRRDSWWQWTRERKIKRGGWCKRGVQTLLHSMRSVSLCCGLQT